ncbi:hypothetical protein BEE62_15540 [Marinobacter nauticus]|uniref:PilY1 beta-propeller domain-containing protein n=2 Tax=Marinobacter nauticus TaxID=2743 RepID=A0A1M2UTB4_MARNT|nr:hypothetical protein BEE62_15540 [Marinobacter nauticus]
MASVTLSSATAYAAVSQKPLFLTGEGLPPNILLIPDTSESMQEGLSQGRIGLDWENCSPGANMSSDCVAGARYENSKGSIVKRVSRTLVDEYAGIVNMGLLSYQQLPPGEGRDDVFSSTNPKTALWFLTHRPADLRFSTNSNPSWYDPDHDEGWDSDTKRFREPHPTLNGVWIFYNVAVPGYYRSASDSFPPTTSRDTWGYRFRDDGCTSVTCSTYRLYQQMNSSSGAQQDPDSSLWFSSQEGSTWNITLTDSMRARGVNDWGTRVGFISTGQLEWRANASPGLGYLHVPIGGIDASGNIVAEHWSAIRKKLEPQRHDWDSTKGDIMTNADWPLIASGLTPLAGTMQTATDYFIGRSNVSGSRFRTAQGYKSGLSIPQSCGVNAAIWITDGLPSVGPDGTALGTDPVGAMLQARDAVKDFYDQTAAHSPLGGAVKTYVVGFAMPPGVSDLFSGHEDFTTANPLDVLAAAGGTETAFNASDEASLVAIINQIFEGVVDESGGSAASAAASSTSLQTDTAIFVAGFDSTDWTGELKAYRVNRRTSDEDDLLEPSPAWNAENKLPAAASRNILTWVPDSSVTASVDWAKGRTEPFKITATPGGLSAAQLVTLSSGGIDAGDLVGWLRGDQSNEGSEAGDLRRRSRVIGDIVNSSPLYIRNQNFNYQLFPEAEGGKKYNAFLDANRSKSPLIAVASNNGMLHVFDARLPCRDGETTATDGCSSDGGKEVFSYIPNALMSRLPNLAKQDYDREYYFDGSPRIGHVYDGSKWRRILVASLGAGGKAVVAIDIDAQEVLWEIDASHDVNLGYVLGDPILGKAASGEWITVIPNGYDSKDKKASLIILNTLTGEEITTWTPTGSNPTGNAMFEPLPLDVTGDRRIDRIYAGDLEGNLWRYDLDPKGPKDWGVINKLKSGSNDGPLFTAVSPEGQKQPITVRPNAARDPSGIIHLVFGTGKYFEIGDNAVAGVPTQSLYGIRDEDDTVARSDLIEQSIIYEGTEHGFDVRVSTSTDLVVGSNRKGWRLDLIYDGQNNGERLVQNPIIRGSRAVFATLIPEPNPNPCEPGDGTGWIMEIDAFNGARLSQSPWDLSGDGFGEESFVNEPDLVPASGIRSPVGIPTIPAVVEDHQLSDREYKFVVGSTGQVWELPDESRDGAGRQFWRQLR